MMLSDTRKVGRVNYYLLNNYPDQKLPRFFHDLRLDKSLPYLRFPEQYDGNLSVKLVCSQHGDTPYHQKKITQSWIDFLTKDKYPFREVQFCSRTSPAIFEAICTQTSIESLWIKWCAVPDLSAIKNLKNLKKLYVGLGTSVEKIDGLAELQNLEVLCLDNTKKVIDYSPLGSLKNLKALDIGGSSINPAVLDMQSDAFLFELTKLEFLHLPDVRITERSFLFDENVQSFKYAFFRK
ncbi:MAG: hypothetical protein IKM54_01495 [Butyricicoccus sp.]|nr:hypothetical protein [Butyricicoccus sp.]